MIRCVRLALLTMLMVFGVQANAFAMTYEETPYFEDLVKAGKIDPVAKRLPEQPRVIDLEALGRKPGVHGGKMRMLMGSKKDVRMMVYYGYSRLVGYDLNYKLQADILARYEVEDGRIFTLHLRPGPPLVRRCAVHCGRFSLYLRRCDAEQETSARRFAKFHAGQRQGAKIHCD